MHEEQVNFYLDRFRDRVKDVGKADFSGIFTKSVKELPTSLKNVAEREHEQFFKDIQQNHGNMDFQLQN